MTTGDIFYSCVPKGKGKATIQVGRGSPDIEGDVNLMETVLEYKYAAARMGKVLVVDFVPPWKAWICREVLKMEVADYDPNSKERQ